MSDPLELHVPPGLPACLTMHALERSALVHALCAPRALRNSASHAEFVVTIPENMLQLPLI